MKVFNKISRLFQTKSLKVNSIFSALYQLLTLLAPIITTPYISRIFSPSTIGNYNYYYSILGYFTLFSAFGFVELGTKVIAENRDDLYKKSQVFYSVFLAKALMSLLCLVAYLVITISIFYYDKTAIYIFIAMSLYVISNMLDPLFYFQGEERFVSISIRNMIMRLFTIIMTFVLVRDADDIVLYALVLSVGNILATVVTYFSFKKGDLEKPCFKDIHPLPYFSKALPFFITSLAVTLFTSLNQTFLGALSNDSNQNGYYSQGVKIIVALASVIGSISTIMLSRMSYLFKTKNEEEIKKKMVQTFEAFFAVGFPMMFGYFAINKYLIPLFLGGGYEGAIMVGYILTPVIILSPLNGIFGNLYFRPFNKIWIQTIIVLVSSVINIGLCVVLIPKYGAIGSSIARLLAELIQLPLLIHYSKSLISIKTLLKIVIKPFDNALIMFICLYFCNNFLSARISSNTKLFVIEVVIGVVIYGICAIVTKDKFVMSMLKWIFGKFKKKKLNS